MATAARSATDLTTRTPARRLVLCGETCPTTTAETLRVLDHMAVGEVLEVESDYYPARSTIPYHCAKRGYRSAFVDDGDAPGAAHRVGATGQVVWRIRIERS